MGSARARGRFYGFIARESLSLSIQASFGVSARNRRRTFAASFLFGLAPEDPCSRTSGS